MYILLQIMSTVPSCLNNMQDEMEKGVMRYRNYNKKRKFLWLKDFK